SQIGRPRPSRSCRRSQWARRLPRQDHRENESGLLESRGTIAARDRAALSRPGHVAPKRSRAAAGGGGGAAPDPVEKRKIKIRRKRFPFLFLSPSSLPLPLPRRRRSRTAQATSMP